MSTNRTDPHVTADSTPPVPESNGVPTPDRSTLIREVMVLRARCSNLRRWCRALLEDPAAAGVLDETMVADLIAILPTIGETEAHELIGQLTRGSDVPANHPLAPKADDEGSLRAAHTSLTTEHERLRRAFFALYDHLYPGDDLTDEYFLAQQGEGPMRSMADVLAEFEREFGEQP